jgi:hypothetical protein
MWEQKCHFSFSWQEFWLNIHFLFLEVSFFCLPLLICEYSNGIFENFSFLLSAFKVGLNMFQPLLIEIFRNGHVHKSQSSMDLISIQEKISWCSFIVITFGFSADKLVGIKSVSDSVSCEQASLHDRHCRRYKFYVGDRFSRRDVLWTIGEVAIAVKNFDDLLLIEF